MRLELILRMSVLWLTFSRVMMILKNVSRLEGHLCNVR